MKLVAIIFPVLFLTAALTWVVIEWQKEKAEMVFAMKAQEEVINKISRERSDFFLQREFCFMKLDEIRRKEGL